MNLSAKLTLRERDITELLAWGASKKEVAIHLFISERTVENHARNIYEKTGCNKVNELSAWWFCFRFRIPMSLSPLARRLIAGIFLIIYSFGAMTGTSDCPRIRNSRTRITALSYNRGRRNENNYKIFAA